MRRSSRTLGLLVSVAALIASAPQSLLACFTPLPPNVGVSLTETGTGLQLTIFGGEAYGSPSNEGCGCTVGIPSGLQKLGCIITSVAMTDPNGNDVGFGTFAENANTGSTFTGASGGLLDNVNQTVVGFATTLSMMLLPGTSLKLTIDLTCPLTPELRQHAAKSLAHSAAIGTGPVLPDGSIDLSQPTHIGFTTGSVSDKCQAKKKLCVSKKAACLFGCHAKAEQVGIPVDPVCLQKCTKKFDGGVIPEKACFAKLEAKGGCMVTNHVATVEASTDAFVEDVVTQLDPAYPAPVMDPCSVLKKKCTAKKTAALLKCHAKAEAKAVPVNAQCVAKLEEKFIACFTKAEVQLCNTLGDAAAIEATVDAFVNDVVCQIDPATCP